MRNTRSSFFARRVSKASASIALACGVGIGSALGGASLAAAQQSPSSSYGSADGSARSVAGLGSSQALGSSQGPSDMLSSNALGSLDPRSKQFYDSIPTEVTGKPGQVIKRGPSQFALGLPYVDWTLSKAERVAYVSTNSNGKSIPVTGTVLKSSAPWTGKGPRPLLTIAPGTQGSGDACAPGKLLPVGLEYEAIPVAGALLRGWNVALTDLPGLGTPGQHTYMNRVDQAHATIDMARAATNMNIQGIDSNSPVAFYGYSQGGGASAAALELAPTYGKGVNLKTGYAGGTPANLAETAAKIDGKPLAGALGYAINGFVASKPELRPLIDDLLNEKGKRLLKQTADECIPQSIIRHAYVDTRTLTKSGKSLADLLKQEPLKSILAEHEIEHRAPNVPVFVGHGANDDTIPVQGARTMVRQWCSAGTKVYYRETPIPPLAPLVDHMVPMLANQAPAMNWLDAVFRGKSYPTTNCGQIPG
ncbi:lipase family protein [uncultured Corynebacterium sp.]|uniref:lipase family protein n=1 Tax=uncultured Corynebacterium sp. TaxID=159447 RepID=UPI0025F2B105|nr:lipase family protein [uncultured Corynebacterium sp.]